MPSVPEIRISACNSRPANAGGQFVLYWMIAFRRLHWNFSLDRALEWARKLRKPLVILEPLRCDYPWANDRFHRFILDGMAERADALARSRILYYPHVEPSRGAARGLLETLSRDASVIVTDDFPCFFLPRMVQKAAATVAVRLEAVDSNGLLPFRAAGKMYPTAFSFRRFLQNHLPPHLSELPKRDPIAGLALPRLKSLPKEITTRWPPESTAMLKSPILIAGLPISHQVGEVALRGGEIPAATALRRFLTKRLRQYPEARNEPEKDGASGLSPYLHFGHISAHQIFHDLMKPERWSDKKLALRPNGSRTGWWGVSPPAEAFLDQFITWRELGFNASSQCDNFDQFDSLPPWALKTLADHARDERSYLYTREEFADARTHDPLWNAAQRQLLSEGRIQNYLRMLWGKKILEWSRTPQEALETMVELNNTYALDGRDPNSYSGIFWCLGRYDRPWGPERPVYGKVRYMSSANTARKYSVKAYLEKYSSLE